MCALEVFVYPRKWVECTQTVQPRYTKDCGAQRAEWEVLVVSASAVSA